MPLPANSVQEGIMFLGCPSGMFVHLSAQIMLPWYLGNGFSSSDETYREYSL